jgi:hypothetical protein
MAIFSPAGTEESFLEAGAPTARTEPDLAAALAAAIRHGWAFVTRSSRARQPAHPPRMGVRHPLVTRTSARRRPGRLWQQLLELRRHRQQLLLRAGQAAGS